MTLRSMLVLATVLLSQAIHAQDPRPNIVLMFPDNLGWGEVGAYGAVRGVPTPNIDSIAAQGIRLDNFNVEFSCTVSRAALLTGRYAIRAPPPRAQASRSGRSRSRKRSSRATT